MALRRAFRCTIAVSFAALLVVQAGVLAQPAVTTSPTLTVEQQEVFLKQAKVVRSRPASKGVTGTLRATLSDGTITHDASIQTIDQSMPIFKGKDKVELNFKDTWRYNVAAYRLNRLLQLGNIPVSVERRYDGKDGSFTWWVDDVAMDEGERMKQKADSPDKEGWNRQMYHVRVFDQLIQNVDRNLGNLLIDKNWVVWMIDHTRAFRLAEDLKSPASLRRIERGAFQRLKALDQESLDESVGDSLTRDEKRRLLDRRDAIVAIFEKAGPAALFDATPQP